MICSRCMLRALPPQSRQHVRQFTSASRRNMAPPTKTEHQATQSPLHASHSTSKAQPFSIPPSVSPTAHGIIDAKPKPQPPIVMSSVPAGKPLKGLNFIKGKTDPVAMEDSEYPEWLWRILEDKEVEKETGTDADIYSKSRSKRAKAIKKAKKAASLNPETQMPKVPIYEQSIDLPSGDGTVQGAIEAAKARGDLTKAMRIKRRSAIKENNFLRTMR